MHLNFGADLPGTRADISWSVTGKVPQNGNISKKNLESLLLALAAPLFEPRQHGREIAAASVLILHEAGV